MCQGLACGSVTSRQQGLARGRTSGRSLVRSRRARPNGTIIGRSAPQIRLTTKCHVFVPLDIYPLFEPAWERSWLYSSTEGGRTSKPWQRVRDPQHGRHWLRSRLAGTRIQWTTKLGENLVNEHVAPAVGLHGGRVPVVRSLICRAGRLGLQTLAHMRRLCRYFGIDARLSFRVAPNILSLHKKITLGLARQQHISSRCYQSPK